MVDGRVIQYIIFVAFAIYLVVYFRFDEWFKESPPESISLEDISQRSSYYSQPPNIGIKTSYSQSSSARDSGTDKVSDNSSDEESRLQQIFRALSSTFSSSSSDPSSSSSSTSNPAAASDDTDDEFLLSHGISMDKSVLTKLKQSMVDEDEQKADRIIHEIILKIKEGRQRLAQLATTRKKETGKKIEEKGKTSAHTVKKDATTKKTPPKDECDFKWPTFSAGEPYSYERVEGYQVSESFVFSGPGCNQMDDQCSAATVADAERLCNSFTECLAFTCNNERHDCQLRFGPLRHLDSPHFVSYYKPGIRDLADKRDKCDAAKVVMQRGALAAPDFNWNGKCGEDHKCVISYGLYGGNPKYTEGALRNVELQPKIYPGWVVRVYHDDTVPQSILDELEEKGAELVKITGIGGSIAGMFWRFLVADDSTVDRYIIRDSDSRLNLREKAVVDEWVDSGYSIHSIRDHPNHHRGLNGGMWGGVRGAIKDMHGMITTANRVGYAADLDFLNNRVWPTVELDQISHDSYSCQHYKNSHPFPTERKNYEHVGQVFEHNQPRMSDINCCMINNPTPVSCRKKKEWTYG